MSRNRRVIAVALAVVLFGASAIVFAAVAHRGSKRGSGGGPSPTSPTSATLPAPGPVDTTPIPGLSADAFGISTGVQLFNENLGQIDQDIAGIAALGTHWMRTAVRWDLVERTSPNSDDWTKVDRIVDDAQQHKLSLILNITGTPVWARRPGAGNVEFPPDLHTYATFMGKIAARYKGRVAAYELGNEPNHVKSFRHPDPTVYEKVLQFSYPLIKAADPSAKVLTGGLGGSNGRGVVAGDAFLAGLYAAGAKPYFDGVSYHPYTYPLLPSNDSGERGWSRMLTARQTMVANGDADKKIWITEYGAPTSGPNSVSQDQQAAIMYDAYRLWATYSWAGPLCWFDYRDKGTNTGEHANFFGLYAKDGQPKVALKQYETLARSAS
jgi:Cellulase (glycosyl hydrolase family 5)